MGGPGANGEADADLSRWTGHYGLDGRDSTSLFHAGESRIAADPADPAGWALVARAAHLTRNTPFAVQALQRAFALGAREPSERLYLARLFCELGDPAAARQALEPLAGLDVEGLDFTRGVIALAERSESEAKAAFAAEASRGGAFAAPARWAADYCSAALDGEAAPAERYGPALRSRWSKRADGDGPLIAVLDYKSPDLGVCSANLGDSIQTLAVLRELARFENVTWASSDPTLPILMADLAARTPVAARRPLKGLARVEVLDRDVLWPAAHRFAGAKVWALIYGWFFHRSFLARGPFPGPGNLEPLVFSFHLASPGLLEPAAVEWLRPFAPIGCRDWTTVGWLLNRGVDAFFSGCVTTTFSAPVSAPNERGGTMAVDAPPDAATAPDARLSHHDERLRIAPFDDIVRASLARLDLYASASSIVTSRLHCLLPCRSLGKQVEFRPMNADDSRYEGLADASPDDLRAMAADLSGQLGPVLAAIIQRAPAAEVRALWRKGAAAKVEAARAHFGVGASGVTRAAGAPARIAPAASGWILGLAADAKTLRSAQVSLASAVAGAEMSLDVALLDVGLDASERAALSAIPGAARVMLVQGSAAAPPRLDRLVLAAAVPDGKRMVYLGPATVVLADLAELAACDPGPFGIAARPSPVPWLASLGHAIEERIATGLARDARALRRFAAANVDLTAPYFDLGACVLHPARLAAAGVEARARDLIAEHGIDESMALNLLANGAFAALPSRWNVAPYFELTDGAALLHWPTHPPPWLADRKVLGAESWFAHEPQHPDTQLGLMASAADGWVALEGPFAHRGGAAWTAARPGSHRDHQVPASRLVLREDGRGLGPSNAMEADIVSRGRGRYAVWPEAVCFSTSDGSDPNRNGRAYALTFRTWREVRSRS